MRRRSYLKGLGLGIFVTALIMSLSSGKAKGEISDEEIIRRAEKLGMVSENAMLLTEARNLADSAQKKGKTLADVKEAAEGKGAPSGNDVSGNASVSANGEIIKPEDVSGNKTPPAGATASEKEDRASVAGAGTADVNNKQSAEQASKEAASKKTASEEAAKAKKEEAGEAAKAAADASDPGDNSSSSETVTITVNSGESSISVASKMVQAGLISDARQFDSYLVLSGYDRKLVVGSHPIPKGATAEEMGKILTTKQ